MRQPVRLSLPFVLLVAIGCNNGSPTSDMDAQSSLDATSSEGGGSPAVYTLPDGAMVLVWPDGAVQALDGAFFGPRADAALEVSVAPDANGMDATVTDTGNGVDASTVDALPGNDVATLADSAPDVATRVDACVAAGSCEIPGSCEVGRIDCVDGGPVCVGTGVARPSGVCRPAPGACAQDATCNGTSTICPPNVYSCACETTQMSCEQWPFCNWQGNRCTRFGSIVTSCSDARNQEQCVFLREGAGANCSWHPDRGGCVAGP